MRQLQLAVVLFPEATLRDEIHHRSACADVVVPASSRREPISRHRMKLEERRTAAAVVAVANDDAAAATGVAEEAGA